MRHEQQATGNGSQLFTSLIIIVALAVPVQFTIGEGVKNLKLFKLRRCWNKVHQYQEGTGIAGRIHDRTYDVITHNCITVGDIFLHLSFLSFIPPPLLPYCVHTSLKSFLHHRTSSILPVGIEHSMLSASLCYPVYYRAAQPHRSDGLTKLLLYIVQLHPLNNKKTISPILKKYESCLDR